jgi:hypothetical protein
MPRALIDSSALIGGLPEDVLGALEQHCSSTIVRAELAHGLSVFVATGQRGGEPSSTRSTRSTTSGGTSTSTHPKGTAG